MNAGMISCKRVAMKKYTVFLASKMSAEPQDVLENKKNDFRNFSKYNFYLFEPIA